MHRAVKITLFVAAVTGVLVFASMGVSGDDAPAAQPVSPPTDTLAKAWNELAIDSAISLLQTGNVVLRMGMGAQSHLLAQMNRGNKSFSHCGIVLMEDGYPFIYHSIGGEDNPDARLKRDSAIRFFSPASNTSIAIVRYDLGPGMEKELVQDVRTWYRSRPRFDMQFDLSSDDKLYCTEFVYKVLVKAAKDEAYIPTASVMGREFVGTDNLFTNRHANLVWQVKFK